MRADSNAGANCTGVTLLVLSWDIFSCNFELINAIKHTHSIYIYVCVCVCVYIYIYIYIYCAAERRICECET